MVKQMEVLPFAFTFLLKILKFCRIFCGSSLIKPQDYFMENKIIDWETAIERLGGDRDFLIELLNELVEQIDQTMPELKQAIENANYSEVRSLAHGLKGAAANLGADKISAKFYEMELMGKEERLENALASFEDILQMNDELKQELAKA